jgi:hypothetical protein
MELVNLDVKDTYNGLSREATFKDLKTGQNVTMNFGTFLTTPANRKRKIYEGNDLADEHVSSKIIKCARKYECFSYLRNA